MNIIKSVALAVLSIGSGCSLEAMDQVGQAVDEVFKQLVVTQGDIIKLIRDGHAKTDYQPEEALGLFQQAYDKAGSRMWELGLKDGKLVWVACYDSESDQTDSHDVKVWKLLLDKVELFRAHTEDALQEKAALLCALTARKLTAAYCLSLSLAQDVDRAWQADTLEKIHDRTAAERLANARAAIKQDFQDSLVGDLGSRPVDLDECNEVAKRELRKLEAKRDKKIRNIVAQREREIARLKEAEAHAERTKK